MELRLKNVMKSKIFTDPMRRIIDNSVILDDYIKRMENAIKKANTERKSRYIEIITKLDTLSPLKTLLRGYTLTEMNGNIIRKSEQLQKGDIISIKFCDGKKDAEIL